jgi:hypothetical protein
VPISTRLPAVIVEYDRYGKRFQRRFQSATAARRFYAAKLAAGKNPEVKRA